MRIVIQRVQSASVRVRNPAIGLNPTNTSGSAKPSTQVEAQTVSSIGPGLLCLVGIKETDTEKDAEYCCKKILKTKAFPNKESGRPWDVDVVSGDMEILLVSQFTLYGRLKKAKPDFSKAMGPSQAADFYQKFVERVRQGYAADKVKDGVFGAMMEVELINDGPVTFMVDSESSE